MKCRCEPLADDELGPGARIEVCHPLKCCRAIKAKALIVPQFGGGILGAPIGPQPAPSKTALPEVSSVMGGD